MKMNSLLLEAVSKKYQDLTLQGLNPAKEAKILKGFEKCFIFEMVSRLF